MEVESQPPANSGVDKAESGQSLRPLSGKQPLSYKALRDTIDLALWAGQLLLQYGANSERVEGTVHRIGTGLGCTWLDVDVSLDALTITAISGEDFRTKTRRIIRRGVNFKVVTAVNDLGRHVADEHIDRHQARAELEQIAADPPGFPFWLSLLAVSVACAAFSRLFGGDWIAFITTLVAAGVAMLLRQQLANHYFNPYLIVIATAFAASLVASAADVFFLPAEPGVAIIASVLFLVPGVPLINAAQDLMREYTDNGISRGIDGLIISLSIAIGVFFTLSITGLRLPYLLPGSDPVTSAMILQGMLWAAVASLGFAILFQVPRRNLPYCALLGALGYGARTLLLNQGFELVVSSLVGATLVGIGGYWLSRRYKMPSAIYSVPGIIPLVPGSLAFHSMVTLIRAIEAGPDSAESLFVISAFEALTVGLIIFCLGVGISAPFLLMRRQKPVV